ncbi:MAG TPA: thiosulfate oxidation carrier protein SoxY [Thiothrix sp.]|nr:thiosulfate oxidation carrier protein SoxY [Thiothrix sp.]
MERRKFLKNTLSASAVVSVGALAPAMVFADGHGDKAAAEEKPAAAAPAAAEAPAGSAGAYPFHEKGLAETLKALGAEGATESADIKLKAPDVAENGAVVPITIDATAVAGTDKIALLSEKNGTPLVAVIELKEGAAAFFSSRIKMGKSGKVIAIAMAGDKAFTASKEVKVTIGGCGG